MQRWASSLSHGYLSHHPVRRRSRTNERFRPRRKRQHNSSQLSQRYCCSGRFDARNGSTFASRCDCPHTCKGDGLSISHVRRVCDAELGLAHKAKILRSAVVLFRASTALPANKPSPYDLATIRKLLRIEVFEWIPNKGCLQRSMRSRHAQNNHTFFVWPPPLLKSECFERCSLIGMLL